MDSTCIQYLIIYVQNAKNHHRQETCVWNDILYDDDIIVGQPDSQDDEIKLVLEHEKF